jgi:hypothetical protein
MRQRLVDAIFSLSGLAIAIGTLGFLSGIVTLFVDTSSVLSIKWLLFTLLISISAALIFLKIIFDIISGDGEQSFSENPIRYVAEEKVFVIRRNYNFLNNIIVGCYVHQNEIDRLAYLGVVHLVQDAVIQIKIEIDMGVLEKVPESPIELKSIFVRAVVPVTALAQLRNLEN